jgi:hypothetical protein
MQFKNWLIKEFDKEDFDHYKNIVLGILNLDKEKGLSQTVSAWEPSQLINTLNNLGEYKNLPQGIQSQVEGQIKSGSGTLGDLIKLMSDK